MTDDPPDAAPPAKPLILVIDDEPDLRKLMRMVLERAGYDVALAENGRAAMKLYDERRPVLTITDILMPEKDGIETMREIRRIDADARIIAISGGGRSRYVGFLKAAQQFGAAETLQKPFRPQDLLAAVRRVLDEP